MDPKPAKRYPKMKCIVPDCNYKERMYPKYHEFPKDPERRRQWIEFCKVYSQENKFKRVDESLCPLINCITILLGNPTAPYPCAL